MLLLTGSLCCPCTRWMESWLFSEVFPRYLLSDRDEDLTGLLPCAAMINVACQAAAVASDVSPRLFLRETTSPEHVTWSTAKVMSCFQLERRAEGLALSQADWRRINVGLTTTWSDSNGQICVAAVLNAQFFCFLSFFHAASGGVCTEGGWGRPSPSPSCWSYGRTSATVHTFFVHRGGKFAAGLKFTDLTDRQVTIWVQKRRMRCNEERKERNLAVHGLLLCCPVDCFPGF